MADTLEQTPAEATQQVNTTEARRAIAKRLQDVFTSYKEARQGIEQIWLRNLSQFLGKYDAEFENKMDPNTSRAYPKLTRVKCISVESRLMSLLFPASEKNWGITPSPVPSFDADALQAVLDQWVAANPSKQPTQADVERMMGDLAKQVAERLERIIDDQLNDVDPYGSRDYEALVRKVVKSGVKYGPGIVKGPMVIEDKVARIELDQSGMARVVETETYRPYFEFVPCWNYYPDLSAVSFAQMEGEFQRHVFSKHQFELLASRGDFDGDVIREYIRGNWDGNYTEQNYENSIRGLGVNGATSLPKGTKYEVLEYWGTGQAQHLRDAGLTVNDKFKGTEQVRYNAWVVGDFVIKLTLNPMPEGTSLFHVFVFEEDEVSLLGTGLPPIMRDSQLGVSAFTRMLVDNASTVCGPSCEVDMSIIDPNQTDLSIRAFQVWRRDGGTAGQRAVTPITFNSHIPDLLNGLQAFKTFADSETFVNAASGGDMENVSGEALRTTGGASMIYGNAALPFKDIVRNFDQFTVSVIHSLVEWNRIFNDDRARLMGDVRPNAKGSTSLMAKEMRSYALDNLAQTLTPEERLYVKPRELLTERLKVRDLPLDTLLEDEETVQQKQAQQAQQSQQQLEQQTQMFTAQLEAVRADTVKALSQGQKNLDNADAAVMKVLLEALNNGASPEQLTAIAERAVAGRQGVAGSAPAQAAPRVAGGAAPASIQ